MYVWLCVCVYVCVNVCTCGDGRTNCRSQFFPTYVDSENWTQIVRLGDNPVLQDLLVTYLIMSVSLPDSTCWAIFLGSLKWPHIYHWGFLEGPPYFYQGSLFARSIIQGTPDSEAGCLPNLKPVWVAEWVQGQLRQLNETLSQSKGKRRINQAKLGSRGLAEHTQGHVYPVSHMHKSSLQSNTTGCIVNATPKPAC